MRLVAIVQARMSSTRLPGKVLLPLAGRAVIGHVLDRLARVRGLDASVVAVPDEAESRPLIELLRRQGAEVFVFDGDPADLLSRYLAAARAYRAEGILMVDSDCPLFDPDTASRMLAALKLHPSAEYVGIGPYTIEGGVACLRRSTFERIDREGARGADREHATLRILRTPGEFEIVDVPADPAFADPRDAHRFWLDTSEDYAFLGALFERLYVPGELLDLRAVVKLLREQPGLRAINAQIRQRDPLAEV